MRLPLAAALAVALVLGVMLVAGGGDYRPARTADPCSRAVPRAAPADIDALAERLVLTGLDEAACELDTSRERLLLALADPQARAALAERYGGSSSRLAAAIVEGLRQAVTRLERADALPPVSRFKDELIERLDLPDIVRPALRAIPDSAVDSLLPTAAVLRRSIDRIDRDEVAASFDDAAALERLLRRAVEQGAIDEARARLRAELPWPARSLL